MEDGEREKLEKLARAEKLARTEKLARGNAFVHMHCMHCATPCSCFFLAIIGQERAGHLHRMHCATSCW